MYLHNITAITNILRHNNNNNNVIGSGLRTG